jgi:heme-degrading monooxygenase HmoA
MPLASTPEPPYYAVIFTSARTGDDASAYEETARRMHELASGRPGFLGVETAREGLGITVSYWADEESIAAWKADAEHAVAQERGRARWYEAYTVRVARVERAYAFTRPAPDAP